MYRIGHSVCFFPYHPAPEASPQEFASANISSRSAVLMWEPPPPENQNGNITHYVINASVVAVDSPEMFQRFSDSTTLTVNDLIPFTTYLLIVAASTSVGIGPFTPILTVQTPEDGELIHVHINVLSIPQW